jgi:hypothetical protein
VFVWVASSVIGDFAKLPEHAAVADQLHQAIAATVFELLAAGLPVMEQNAEMTLEVLELVARALRRFAHLPQTPTFQTSLQFTMVTSAPNVYFAPPNRLIHACQVALASRDERILEGAFHFLQTCLSQPAVAPTLVQHFGRQILTEVLPRIKGVYPKKSLRLLAPVMQRIFMRDMDGMPAVVMDVLRQVRVPALPFSQNRVHACAVHRIIVIS